MRSFQISNQYFMPQLARLGKLMLLGEIGEDERQRINELLYDMEKKINEELFVLVDKTNNDFLAMFDYHLKAFKRAIGNDQSSLGEDD